MTASLTPDHNGPMIEDVSKRPGGATNAPGPAQEVSAPMQAQPNPHRTDAKRGKRERVAPGVFVRAGKFEISFTDPAGADRMRTLGPVKSDAHPNGLTLKDAKAEREKLRVQVRAGEAVTPSRVTFAEVAEDFLELLQSLVGSGERSERTLTLYRQHYSFYLEPRFGRLPIQKIGAEHVARMLADLRSTASPRTKKPLASWTIKGIYTLLGSVFNHALTRGLIVETPLKRLAKTERPRGRKTKQARVLAHAEIVSLLEHALPAYRPILAAALFSGMRLSELLGLRWEDVDFDEGLIRVRYQLSRAAKTKPPRRLPLKTDAGARSIVLLPQLAELLRGHHVAELVKGCGQPSDYVFTTENGTPFYGRNVSTRGLDKAADRAGLNDEDRARVSMHHLRHTFASHLILDLKLDVVTVSRQLGHARPSITSDVYAHLFDQARHADDIRQRMGESDFGKLLEAPSN
jgi:integrase